MIKGIRRQLIQKSIVSAIRTNFVPYVFGGRKNKPLSQQARELTRVYRTYRVAPLHYFRLGLYDRSCTADPVNFIPSLVATKRRIKLQPIELQRLLKDKVAFLRFMNEHEFPHPETPFWTAGGEIHHLDGTYSRQEALDLLAAAPTDFLVKPANGMEGRGVELVTEPEKSLDAALAQPRAILFQERLRPHPDLLPLFCKAINTLRIDTTLEDGEFGHSAACFRLGLGDRIIDNAATGAIVMDVNLATGRLQGGYHTLKQGCREFSSTHPENGVEMDRFQLPDFETAKEMARAAAEPLRDLQTMAWDVALTDKGPIVMEANPGFGINSLQVPGAGMRQTPLGRLLFPEAQ